MHPDRNDRTRDDSIARNNFGNFKHFSYGKFS